MKEPIPTIEPVPRSHRQPSRLRRLAVLSALSLLGVVGTLAFTLHAPALPDDGRWVRSEIDDCMGHLVCAEWVYEGGGYACCIEESQVGSTSMGPCDSSLRHTMHGGGGY